MEAEAILGFPIRDKTLWEYVKMVKAKKRFEFDKVLTVCTAFTGKELPNPYQEQKVLKWAGWKAYGIQTKENENGKAEG